MHRKSTPTPTHARTPPRTHTPTPTPSLFLAGAPELKKTSMKKEPMAVATVSSRHTAAMVWKRLVDQMFCLQGVEVEGVGGGRGRPVRQGIVLNKGRVGAREFHSAPRAREWLCNVMRQPSGMASAPRPGNARPLAAAAGAPRLEEEQQPEHEHSAGGRR